METKDIKSISIRSKYWFQKSFGNTYHGVIICINDDVCIKSTINYGQCYLTTVHELLKEKIKVPEIISYRILRIWCEDNKIALNENSQEVRREKDLKNFLK